MSIFSIQLYGLVFLTILILAGMQKFLPENRKAMAKNLVILFANAIFLLYASWKMLLIMMAVSLATWAFGNFQRKICQKIGIAVLILTLAYFKYTNFFVGTIFRFVGKNSFAIKIILPLGISFYVFSAISYLVDVMSGKVEKASLLNVTLYLSYFPKLVSGPIQRSGDFFRQIGDNPKITKSNILSGLQIYVFGLFKKIVLADHLAVFVDEVYATPACFSWMSILLAIFSYSLQIYFDFSGYTDMALGISKMLGINLPRNFNLPYMASNVSDFWRRWHITLSEWIRDYIYIPLGGNRKGVARADINSFCAMLLSGLWHGAGWNFVVWGGLYGALSIFHRHFPLKRLPKWLSILFTFFLVSALWVFFRSESINDAFEIFKAIFTLQNGLFQPYFWSFVSFAFLIAATFIAYKKDKENCNGFYPILNLSRFWQLVAFFVVIGLTLALCYTGGSPFIYAGF